MTNNTDISAVKTEYAAYPAGRYEQYESKILKLAKALSFIRRHKIVLSVAVCAVIAAFVCFTYCIGIFTESIQCEDRIYGEPLSAAAEAFLTKVRFEYSKTGDGGWSSDVPVVPGEYYVRGVSENPFGKLRYSNTDSFLLLPRDAEIIIPDATCEYGTINDDFLKQQIQLTGFAEGDRLVDIEFAVESESWETVTVSVASFRIVNADGTDVTASYNVTQNSGSFTVLPRKITVSTSGEKKTYDAKPIERPEWHLKYGLFAEGDELEIFYASLPINAGRYSAVPDDYKIIDATGQDVTHKYDVQFEYGVLIVDPIHLLFSTGSGEKVYDGTPLTNETWELLDGILAEGHTLSAETVGTRTIVGTSKNILSISVVNENGEKVTGNYSVTVNTGTLTVTPIVLKFTTESAEKVYDGKPLKASGYRLVSGQVLPGHRLVCETNGAITDVGTRNNTLSVTVYNEYGVAVTQNGYLIEADEGALTVTPRPITISSASAEKLYDGIPLTAHTFTIVSGSLATGETINSRFTGSQTAVGESANYFSVSVEKGNGANSTKNYDITLKYGTLKVLPNENYDPGTAPGNGNGNGGDITVHPGGSGGGGGELGGSGSGESGDYDFGIGSGTSIGFPSPDASETIYARVKLTGKEAYPFTAFLRVTSYGNYNGSGFDAANEYTESYISPLDFIGQANEGNGNNIWIMHIERLSGCPVIIPYYSYNSYMFGTSDSYFRSQIMEYDYPFVRLSNTTSVAAMKQYCHGAFYTAVKDYTEFVYGEYLQIPESTKAELLRIGEENGIYDSDDKFVLADIIRKYVQNAGTYNLYGEQYPPGVDVAVYFLDVAKEGVCQHFATAATMMYRAYGIPARYVTGFSVNVEPNTTVSVSTYDRHAWVEIYFDELGWIPVEVTGSGFGVAGTKTEISVSAYSATKEYDGKIFSEWKSEKVAVTKGQLLPGHTMKVQLNEGRYYTAPGVYKNEIASVKIYDSNGEDVTDKYYKVSYKDGEMTIKKRSLVIKLGSASKKYDGTPLKCEEWRLVSGTILPNTEIKVETLTEITDVGTAVNRILHVYVYETKNGVKQDVSDCYDIKVLTGMLEITEE